MRSHSLPPLVSLIALLFTSPVAAESFTLSGLPSETAKLQGSFVDAWLALRREMDGLTSVRRNPEMIDAWFKEMPDYLLRDILRLASEHEVVYQSAETLLKRNGKQNRNAVLKRFRRHEGTPLGDQLAILLIAAGDRATMSETVAALKRPVSLQQIEAAAILAAAGNALGINRLRREVDSPSEAGVAATIGLGRHGDLSEALRLERVINRHPQLEVREVALGELSFRRYFPKIYKLFQMQHRFNRRSYVKGGLYETWMTMCLKSAAAGIRTLSGLKTLLSRVRKKPPIKGDTETVRRQLALFEDFLGAANKHLNAPASPPWPQTYSEALSRINLIRSRELEPDTLAAMRISSIIAIILKSGAAISYPSFATPTADLRALSASGERTLDGNLATSWQIQKKGVLILEHVRPGLLKKVQVMLNCPQQKRPARGTVSIEVEGRDREKAPWRIRRSLTLSNRFFQQIDVDRYSSGRVSIRLHASPSKKSVCVPEVRMVLEKNRNR